MSPEGTAMHRLGHSLFPYGDAQAHEAWMWSLDSGHAGSKLRLEAWGLHVSKHYSKKL